MKKNPAGDAKIIQFIHPGTEHRYRRGETYKPANPPPHERNFIRAKGSYAGRDGSLRQDELCFWGEWENEAHAAALGSRDASGIMPHHLITPVPAASPAKAMNTDPFVFGKGFKYFCCQQHDNGTMTRLKRGDIILFGSHKGAGFVLDTLFVVARAIPYETASYDGVKKALPKDDFTLFFTNSFVTMAEPDLSSCGRGCGDSCGGQKLSRVLYVGATFEEPVDGMYSFAPAMPVGSCPAGFARPALGKREVPGISPDLRQGFKAKIDASDRQTVWKNICSAVFKAGCVLGVHFAL